MDSDFFEKLARGEIEPDFVIEPEMIDFTDERVVSDEGTHDAVDLRAVGATIYRRSPTTGLTKIPILHSSPELARDLVAAGYRTADQWREWIDAVYSDSKAEVYPGDLGYEIFMAKAKIGNKKAEVWIEQFDTDEAGIYYPHER